MRKKFWIPLTLIGAAAIGFFGFLPGYVEGSMNAVDGQPLIKVSDEDLTLLYPGEAPESIALRWLQGGCELVVLTPGREGAQLFSRRQGEFYVEAKPVNVRDTVGAGDTFQAALLSYLHEHELDTAAALAQIQRDQLQAMLAFAVQAAAITCSRRGPDLPYRYEIV